MDTLLKEPLLFISIGGMALVQAVIGLFVAFGHAPTAQQLTAINGLATVILTILSRMVVVPTAALPAGVAAQIADAKAAKAADGSLPPFPKP